MLVVKMLLYYCDCTRATSQGSRDARMQRLDPRSPVRIRGPRSPRYEVTPSSPQAWAHGSTTSPGWSSLHASRSMITASTSRHRVEVNTRGCALLRDLQAPVYLADSCASWDDLPNSPSAGSGPTKSGALASFLT